MELIPAACPTLDTPPPYLAHSMLLKAQDICGFSFLALILTKLLYSMLLKAQDICGLSFLALRHALVQFSKGYEV